MNQGSSYQVLTIQEIRNESNGVKLFYLNEEGQRIQYKAGQYLTLIFSDGNREVRRSYSIASSPFLQEPLCIGVKRIANGLISRRLTDSAKAGDRLLTSGAGGVFVLPEVVNEYRQLFFFAAGSGIVPLYSITKTALHAFPELSILLIYSNHSIGSTLFYSSLKKLEQQFPDQLRIEFLFSNHPDLLRARLHADLIESYLTQYSMTTYDRMLFYICGPESYMRLCTFTLHRLGVPASGIKKEIFQTTRLIPGAEPPDKAPHNVLLVMEGKEYNIKVFYPATILQAAKKEGIVLPYSCEAGQCGNCLARCLRGRVWMSYNEVLTATEIAQGLVLTCTGYPVGGDVVLQVKS